MEQNTNSVGEIKDTFLINLKFVMNEKGLKYEDLGSLLGGMTKQGVSSMLNKAGGLNTTTMESVAHALGFKGPELCDPEFRIKYLSQKKD